MKLNITISETEEKEFQEFLHNQIRAFNDQNSPYFLQVRKPRTTTPLNIILKDENANSIGGLTATTYWGWFDIEDFFLPESIRRKGFGKKILDKAEIIAIERGCTSAYLTTYAFQARDFYEKQGYIVVGTLKDYPPGSEYYWMRKNF